MRYLYHISDIHIFSANYNNIKYGFQRLIIDITKYESYTHESLLIIAGDIFENKTTLAMEDIYVFYQIINMLIESKIRTIIIPGNHDYNINSKLVRNNIDVLLQPNPYVICLSTTQMYEIDDIELFIFSPIDKKIPERSHSKKIKVAILHESINGASFDNGEVINNARFNVNDFSGYDFVLLGDIHKPQFLSKRIAYCGSFVQKNKGEGLEHGYILWDLVLMRGSHKFIPLAEVYLKLEARNNECKLPDLLKQQKIRYITLIHEKCDAAFLEDTKLRIATKYGNPYVNKIIDKNNYATPVTLDGKVTRDDFEESICISSLIENSLNKNEINDAMRSEVLKYHKELLESQVEVNHTNYRINYLYWNNILCYKENNWINFREFENDIVMINGPNKVGKSTLIDILIRVMFNESCRGDKDQFVNKHKKSGNMKLSFNIGDDEYIIEKMLYNSTATSPCRIYKNGFQLETGGLIETSDFIKKKIGIGEYKYFLNMTTALQNRKFLVDLSNKDLADLFTNIFELDNLGKLEQKVITEKNKALGAETNIIKQLEELKHDDENLCKIDKEKYALSLQELETIEKDMKIIMSKINALNKEYFPIEASEDISLENLGKLISENFKHKSKLTSEEAEKLSTEIDQLNILLGECKAKIPKKYTTDISEPIGDHEYNLNVEKIKELHSITHKPQSILDESKFDDYQLYINSIKDIETIRRNIRHDIKFHKNIPTEFSEEMDKELIDLCSVVKKREICHVDKSSVLNLANSRSESTDFLRRSINNTVQYIDVSTDEYKDGKIFELEYDTYLKFIHDKTYEDRYNAILEEIKKIEDDIKWGSKFHELKFDISCECCSHNSEYLANFDVKLLASQLTKLKEEYSSREEYEKNKQIYSDRISLIEKYRTIVHNNKICDENILIEKIINARKDLEKIINAEKCDRIDFLQKIKENSLFIENKANIDIVEKYDLCLKMCTDITNQRNWNILRKLVADNANVDFIRYNKIKETISEKKRELKKYKQTRNYKKYVKLYSKKEKNAKIEKLIAEQKVLLSTLENNASHLSKQIEIMNRAILMKNNIGNNIERLEAELVKIQSDVQRTTIYHSIINKKTGIPANILKNICPVLNKRMNKVLNKITDFEIEILYNEKGFHVYTIEKEKRIQADMASGFQKFVIDIIMRIVLTNLSATSSPNLIFIDEGFGCLDQENFVEVAKILKKIKKNFSAMIIITHMNELSAYADKKISIEKNNGFSQLQYGTLSDSEKTLRMQLELKEDGKQVFKQKEQSKRIKDEKIDFERWEKILIIRQEKTYYCNACKKKNKLTNVGIKRHINSIRNIDKHIAYINEQNK